MWGVRKERVDICVGWDEGVEWEESGPLYGRHDQGRICCVSHSSSVLIQFRT